MPLIAGRCSRDATRTASTVETTMRSVAPDDCREHSFGVYKTIPTVHCNAPAQRGIAVLIAGQYLPDRIPTADVGPPETADNDRDITGALDYGIVDRRLGGRRECVFVELHEA